MIKRQLKVNWQLKDKWKSNERLVKDEWRMDEIRVRDGWKMVEGWVKDGWKTGENPIENILICNFPIYIFPIFQIIDCCIKMFICTLSPEITTRYINEVSASVQMYYIFFCKLFGSYKKVELETWYYIHVSTNKNVPSVFNVWSISAMQSSFILLVCCLRFNVEMLYILVKLVWDNTNKITPQQKEN